MVGLVVGLVPPVVIGLLAEGPTTGLLVLVGYLVINNTIDNVVKPKFVGDAVGLSITMSFLSLVVWGFVLGPLGALLAIPATLLVRALLSDEDPRRGWVGIMVGDRAPTGHPAGRDGHAGAGARPARGPGALTPGLGTLRGRARRSAAALQADGLLEHDGGGLPSAGQRTWPLPRKCPSSWLTTYCW